MWQRTADGQLVNAPSVHLLHVVLWHSAVRKTNPMMTKQFIYMYLQLRISASDRKQRLT